MLSEHLQTIAETNRQFPRHVFNWEHLKSQVVLERNSQGLAQLGHKVGRNSEGCCIDMVPPRKQEPCQEDAPAKKSLGRFFCVDRVDGDVKILL